MKQWIHFLLLSVLILSACKTKETVVKQKTDEDTKTQSLDILKLTQPDIKSANFSKLTASINAQGSSLSTNASMKIIRDSIIQISIQPALGIEMARVDFTKNNFVIIDKINGRYFKTDYGFLFTKYKIKLDYASLQAIILNELFIAGEPIEPFDSLVSKFSKSPFPDGLVLKSKVTTASAPTEFILDKDQRINYVSITMPLALTTCRYTDFAKQNNIDFPFAYKISIIEGPKTTSAEINIQAVEFNTAVKINATNLSNYEQVDTFEQLIP